LNVEEQEYTKNDKDKSTIEKEMRTHELIPEHQTVLSFWDKFLELQFTNQENAFPGQRNCLIYCQGLFNIQVHMMGNIVVWYMASSCLVLYMALLVFFLLRQQRLCFDINKSEFDKYVQTGGVLLSVYFAHYLPYLLYD
jgi:dolichyl-phosphate-mannose-protein mannosyltransferase